MIVPPTGVFDPAVFARFRAAPAGSVRRKLLLEQLLRDNMPLVKRLVDQLRGVGAPRKGDRPMAGCKGFRDLEWDDCMQAGGIAFIKAMEQFDPAKGKLAGYLKLKVRFELQCVLYGGGRDLVRVPRGSDVEPIPVALVDDAEVLDRMAGGGDDALALPEGITADMVAEWDRTGEWPESLEEMRARIAAVTPEPVPVDTRTPLERFLETALLFRPPARTPRAHVFGCWERFALTEGAFASHEDLRSALGARGVRAAGVRVPWSSSPVAGLAGVAITS